MAGALVLAGFLESLPLKTTCLAFPVSPVSSWNAEAIIANIKNRSPHRNSFLYASPNPHLYTILSPQSWSNVKSPLSLFWLIEQKHADVLGSMQERVAPRYLQEKNRGMRHLERRTSAVRRYDHRQS